MASSVIPSWKAELLERKRLEKRNAEPVPTWKRELLKRIHSKSELTKHNVAVETKDTEEKLVSDEHIPKVSENVFVRKELLRRMSSGHMIPQLSHDGEVTAAGHHVIRKDDILIIENEDVSKDLEGTQINFQHREMVDVELPSAGTVDRLKDKFAYDRKTRVASKEVATPSTLDLQPTPHPRIWSKSTERYFTSVAPKKEENGLTSPKTSNITHPRTQVPPQQSTTFRKSYSEDESSRPRLPSVELVAPKGFHSRSSVHNFSAEPYHKMTAPPLLKKFSAPLLPVSRSRSASKGDSVDMASLHAPGSPERKKASSGAPAKTPIPQHRKQIERPIDFPKDMTSLHSSSVKTDPPVDSQDDKEIDIKPETITLSAVEVVKLPSASNRSTDVASSKSKSYSNYRASHLSKTPSAEHIGGSGRTAEKPSFLPPKPKIVPKPRTNLPVSNNKENIPEIPPRLLLADTKPKPTSIAPDPADPSLSLTELQTNETFAQNDEYMVIDLGRTSMDPSLLKTKAAIAANEIMKESKTMMIIPRNKRSGKSVQSELLKTESVKSTESDNSPKNSTNFRYSTTNVPVPTSRENTTIKVPTSKLHENTTIKVPTSKLHENTTTVISTPKLTENSVATKPPSNTYTPETTIENLPISNSDDALPSSSVDDVINASPFEKETKPIQTVVFNSSMKNKETKASENNALKNGMTNGTASVASDHANEARNFFVSSRNEPSFEKSSSASNDVGKSIFGSNLKSAAITSTRSFGGKSFMIDPRKMKGSTSQPAISSAPKVESKKKVPSPSTNGTTMVINPKSFPDVVDSASADPDVTSGSKGKRKLTVDQITVIGGYVKLDHSNLSKSNKIHKGIHVRFDSSHLESVFQYPSEASLLHQDQQDKLNERMTSLAGRPGVSKDSQLGKYTPKYLLAMKESLEVEDDDEDQSPSYKVQEDKRESEEVNSSDATPLGNEEATAFSFSSSSNDLLF